LVPTWLAVDSPKMIVDCRLPIADWLTRK